MKRHLNTLFITQEKTFLRQHGETVEVRVEQETKLRVPLHNLDGIAVFAWDCTASAALLGACAEADVAVSFHTPNGKFLSASRGFTSGNVLLRRAQYRASDNPEATLAIARNFVCAKIANCRSLLLRAARDHGQKRPAAGERLLTAVDHLAHRVRFAQAATHLEQLRGIEGDAATFYFAAFPHLLNADDLSFDGRERRPPADPVNALLSFVYTLLVHDCRSALESCGLDPQCGFLHRDRPGRPSLALDLMEEFRPIFADRAALTLFNRQQLTAEDFEIRENSGCYLREDSRKTVLRHWQERKQSEIVHPLLEEKTTLGLLPHLQARLLARYLRGDLDAYPAYLSKG